MQITANGITALATAVLASGAIVTAVFAGLAFRKQGRELVLMEKQQTFDQKRSEVLDLQAQEIRESLERTRREAAEVRQAQARRVLITEQRGPDPRVTQAQAATGIAQRETVTIRVANDSDLPIYDVAISWRTTTASGAIPAGRDLVGTIRPGASSAEVIREVPDHLSPELFGAVAFFRDAARILWRAGPDGQLDEIPAGQEPPHTW